DRHGPPPALLCGCPAGDHAVSHLPRLSCWAAPLRPATQYLALASLAGKLSSEASSTSSHLRGRSFMASGPALRTCTGASLGPGLRPSRMAAAASSLDLSCCVIVALMSLACTTHKKPCGCRAWNPIAGSGKQRRM